MKPATPDVCDLPGAPESDTTHAPIAAELDLADTSPEALLDLFEQRGWGDGLPLVAPTPERVDAMLASGCGEVDPDEVVAILPPRGGRATRRLLAVNAVLAGCPPGCCPCW